MQKVLSITIGLFAVLVLLLIPQFSSLYAQEKPDHLFGNVLVKFTSNAPQQQVASEIKKHNGKVIDNIDELGVLVLKVPEGQEEKVVAALSKNPHVDYVELDYLAYADTFPTNAPDDSYYMSNQWGLENAGQIIVGQVGKVNADINAETAWKVTTGSAVKVAVLDTGIDGDHPDIASQILLQKDFTGSGSVNDFYGHGTHVSGILAAVTNNTLGISGVCPDCKLLNGKVLNDNGSGANSWIANGIIWATDNGAKVINMSLGGSQKSTTLENAVKYAWNHGVVVVAAAGNAGNPSKSYPGAYINAIAVASTNNLDKKSTFSSYGSWVDVAAPGENIYSTFPTHTFYLGTAHGRSQNYDFGSGTSMATPMVAGTAALVWSTSSYGISAQSVRTRIESTADKIAGTGSYWMAGRINAGKAVTQ
jgi:thermitase